MNVEIIEAAERVVRRCQNEWRRAFDETKRLPLPADVLWQIARGAVEGELRPFLNSISSASRRVYVCRVVLVLVLGNLMIQWRTARGDEREQWLRDALAGLAETEASPNEGIRDRDLAVL